eukprot:9895835-Heterocapsa_arctica.AAC.1
MEVGASGHTMIDIANYDENTSLPEKFTNNYDEQIIEPDELLRRVSFTDAKETTPWPKYAGSPSH